MFKIIIALIFASFSTGVLATVCYVHLPSECTELISSDISFHIDAQSKQTFLDVSLSCKVDENALIVDNTTFGEMYHNYKIYKVSVPVSSRSDAYVIQFPKNKKEGSPEFIFLPRVTCNDK